MVINKTNYFITCQCTHLTNFAILVSPYMAEGIHAFILEIVSIVGCSASILGLLITFIAHVVFWKFVKSHHAVVLLNLCVALILGNAVFLGGINQTQTKLLCTGIAGALHFIFVAAFFIMLVEGIQLLLYIIFVFHMRRKCETALLLISAWVLAGVVVALTLYFTKFKGYGNEKACWLTHLSIPYWVFIGCLCLVILCNAIILGIVIRKLFGSSHITDEKKNPIKTSLWNIMVMMPLLGCAWIVGVFSFNEETVAFQYIFAIANAFQGVFIFLFHCLLNKKLRDGIIKHRKERSRSKLNKSSLSNNYQHRSNNYAVNMSTQPNGAVNGRSRFSISSNSSTKTASSRTTQMTRLSSVNEAIKEVSEPIPMDSECDYDVGYTNDYV